MVIHWSGPTRHSRFQIRKRPFLCPFRRRFHAVGFFFDRRRRAATCGKTDAKKAEQRLPLRSEIRWGLFVVLYQIRCQLHAFLSVPEPHDQLTIGYFVHGLEGLFPDLC